MNCVLVVTLIAVYLLLWLAVAYVLGNVLVMMAQIIVEAVRRIL